MRQWNEALEAGFIITNPHYRLMYEMKAGLGNKIYFVVVKQILTVVFNRDNQYVIHVNIQP